jgi:hypothetical protein
MSVIIPQIEKYEVCTYNNRGLTWAHMGKEAVQKSLDNRKFTVVKTFDNIQDARVFITEKETEIKRKQEKPWKYVDSNYVVRFVFKEIEPDADNN